MSKGNNSNGSQARSWTTYQFFNTRLDAFQASNAFQSWDCCDSGHGLIVFGQNSPEGPILSTFAGQISEEETDVPSISIPQGGWRVEQVRSATYYSYILAFFVSPTDYIFHIYSTADDFAQVGEVIVPKADIEANLAPGTPPPEGIINPISISPKLKRFAILKDAKTLRVYESPYNTVKVHDINFLDNTAAGTTATNGNITNHFQVSNFQLQRVIFVTTENGVYSTIRQNNGSFLEPKLLSSEGVKPGFASTTADGRLVCLRGLKVSVYTNTSEDRNEYLPFEIEEDVRMIKWMKNSYLVTVLSDPDKTANVRIYNPQTHAIFGRASDGARVRKLLVEWNSVILILDDNSVTLMKESNMHEKIQQLIKNEQFDVALVVASSQAMGPGVISEIHRQRGDSYQEKHMYQEAINEYKETIGSLEPSYVITRFIDPQHAEFLIDYLEALAEKGKMTKEHTTLLFNCYTKLRKEEKLTQIIRDCLKDAQEKREPKFNLETAVQVLCITGFQPDALAIAKAFRMHKYYTKMLSDNGDYIKILEYIRDVETNVALGILKVYGNDMMMSFNASNKIGFRNYLLEACLTGLREKPDSEAKKKMDIDQLMRVFINHPNELYFFLKEFIERNVMTNTIDQVTKVVWTTMIELCVTIKKDEDEATKYFKMANGKFDSEQLLLIFKAEDCRYGKILLYEHIQYYQELIRIALNAEIPIFCDKFGQNDENMYRLGLAKLSHLKDAENLKKLIDVIAKKDGIPILAAHQILKKYGFATFGILKPLAKATYERKQNHIHELQENYSKMEKDVSNSEDQTNALTYDHFIAKQTRCSGCHQAIDLPAKHFLCGHSFHLRCLGDDLTKCAVCKEEQEKIVKKKVNSFEKSKDLLTMNDSGNGNLYKIFDVINPEKPPAEMQENEEPKQEKPQDQFLNLCTLLTKDLMNPDDDGEKLKAAQKLHDQYTVPTDEPPQ